MSDPRSLRRSCLASSAAWRRQAHYLREQATWRRHLAKKVAASLRREAAAADRMADEWLTAAIESP